jgi:hypothetical protein
MKMKKLLSLLWKWSLRALTVFGHFGYAGCLNSAGDADFGISLSHFTAHYFLGHIHGFREGQGGLREPHSRVVLFGNSLHYQLWGGI